MLKNGIFLFEDFQPVIDAGKKIFMLRYEFEHVAIGEYVGDYTITKLDTGESGTRFGPKVKEDFFNNQTRDDFILKTMSEDLAAMAGLVNGSIDNLYGELTQYVLSRGGLDVKHNAPIEVDLNGNITGEETL